MYKEDTTIKLDEQEVSSEEVMTKFDKESKFRRLSGTPAKIVFVIAVAWSVFQLYTGLFGTFPSTLQRAPHVGAAMVLAYLLYPMNGKPSDKIPFYDYILAALAFACSAYHIVFYDQLLLRAGRFTTADMVISALAILLLLEAARRVAGLVIVCVGSVFLLYALFGNYLPFPQRHDAEAVSLPGMAGNRRNPGFANLRFLVVYFPVSGLCHIFEGQRRGRLDDRAGHGRLRRKCGRSCESSCCSQRFAGYHKRQLGGEYGKHRFDYNPVDEKIRL